MARDTAPAASARRIIARALLLLIPIVVAAVAAPRLLGQVHPGRARAPEPRFRPPTDDEIEAAGRAERRLAEAQRGWERTSVIAPQDGRRDGRGEVVRWFQGFGVSVESTPGAARVLVDGRDVGQSPLVASVQCEPGDAVQIEVRKPPLPAQRRVTTCRRDALVELSFHLSR